MAPIDIGLKTNENPDFDDLVKRKTNVILNISVDLYSP